MDKEYTENEDKIQETLTQLVSIASNLSGVKTQIGKICGINEMSINPAITPNKEFIYIDIDAIQNGTGIINWSKVIRGNQAPSRARRVALSGSTLISTVRPNLKGFAYVEAEKPNAVYSTGLAILKSKNTEVLEDKMIYYQFMYSDKMLRQMIDAMPQGSYPSINVADLSSFEIMTNIKDSTSVMNEMSRLENDLNTLRMRQSRIPSLKQVILDKYL